MTLFLPILIFSATFDGKMGVATMYALWVLDQNLIRKLAHLEDFWVNQYLEKMFLKISGLNPPPSLT